MSAEDRENTRQSLARGEVDEVRLATFTNRTWLVAERFCNIGDGVDSLEQHLHSTWYMYHQLSRHTPRERAEHDRLVLDILRIRGLGRLTRPVSSGACGVDVARTAEGTTVWDELPFLATDLTDSWTDDCASMAGDQRLNCAAFLAKLASTRVCGDRVCGIALVLFRETFEQGRELRTANDGLDGEDKNRCMRDLDVARLLPAAFAWIKEAGHNLMMLSEDSWNDCPGAVGRGGPLFVESELGRRTSGGFSPWRWLYWLKRLHEIQEEAKAAGETRLEQYATDAIELMVNGAQTRNSGILRAYQDGGDVLLQDEHLLCLKDPEFWKKGATYID